MGQESKPSPENAKGRKPDATATETVAVRLFGLTYLIPKRSRKPAPPATKPVAATPKKKTATNTVDLISFASSPAIEGIPSLPPPIEESEAAFLAWRRVRLWAIALGTLVLACIVLSLGPRLYHKLVVWRATQFALQGEELMQKDRVEDSMPYIRSAYTLSPRTPEVLRAMAQMLTAYRSPAAPNYWNWLLQTTDATDDDRRAAIDCAMHYGLFNEALTMIDDLLVRKSGDARNQLLAARWSAERGTPPQTMAFATRAVNDDPTYKPAVLFLAIHELANPYLHQDGVNSLFKLADSDDDSGLVVMRTLALDPNLKPTEIDRLIARLRSHPLAGESEHITALVLEIKRHPKLREILIDRAVAAHQKSAPADLAAFAEWLNTNNEASRVLKLIPRENALSDKSLCLAYLDCLAIFKRWNDINNLLSGATVPLEVPLLELYLSNCAGEMGHNLESDHHWQRAVSATADNPAKGLQLAVYAENHGQNERAAAVYRALTQEPATAHAAYLGLLRVLSDKDTRAQCDIVDQMVSRWPRDNEIASQYVFLHLLLKERVLEMYERAVSLLADDSFNLSLRTNVALACLRLNNPGGALEAYNHAVIDWNTVPVADLAVYAATLHANGQGKAAQRLLVLVNRHALRPELRDLIKSIP